MTYFVIDKTLDCMLIFNCNQRTLERFEKHDGRQVNQCKQFNRQSRRGYKCSNCGFFRSKNQGMSNYCEECGCKMKLVGESI